MSILNELYNAIGRHREELDRWYQGHTEKANPSLYASIDIRNSGTKISAIDTNLFPAGFNNIYPRDLKVASSFLPPYIEKRFGKISRILVIPEDHTRNQPYLKNVDCIQKFLLDAGFEVKIGSLSSELRKDHVQLELGDQKTLDLYRIIREGNRLKVGDFDPDLILLNNDLSQEPPEILNQVEQPLEPPRQAGWYSRKKSRHFEILHRLIDEFCQIIDMDPWFLKAETRLVSNIDIQQSASREQLAKVAEEVLDKTRKQFEAHKVNDEPYVFLKDNSGTYGFAVLTVKNPQEIIDMNSKTRKKMSAGKGNSKVNEILVQEGVPTKVYIHGCPAEPVIYLAAGEVIGGFFRKHCDQDQLKSLNVKGMLFSLMAFSSPLERCPDEKAKRDDVSLQVYGNLARIAYLASGYELQELQS